MDVINEFRGKYSFLSNFYKSVIEFDGIIYPTMEHYFQAQKIRDENMKLRIAKSATPSIAKSWGRHIELRSDWEDIKIKVMEAGLRKKFIGTELQPLLLSTGDAELVEGNHWNDTFWGVDNRTGKGENNLGKLLMKIRSELNYGESKI